MSTVIRRRVLWAVSFAMWCIALFAVRSVWIQRVQAQRMAKEGWTFTDISAQTLIGDAPNVLGSPKAPYTLVEFGDYECPFCRLAAPGLNTLLRGNPDRLRIVFRYLPLITMHPNALNAALAAQSAASQGRFEQMHSKLMASALNGPTLEKISHEIGLNFQSIATSVATSAPARISQDMALAGKSKIISTPTFFLVSPDESVRRFSGFPQVIAYLSKDGLVVDPQLTGLPKMVGSGCSVAGCSDGSSAETGSKG